MKNTEAITKLLSWGSKPYELHINAHNKNNTFGKTYRIPEQRSENYVRTHVDDELTLIKNTHNFTEEIRWG